MSTKEERSEYLGIYVTPTLKRELEFAKDNKTLQETIIKNYLVSEAEWLNEELKAIDESTVKYSAKLVGIKESFSKCQDAYVEEIKNIYNKANETFRKLDSISVSTNRSIDMARANLSGMLTQISSIDFYKIDKMLEVINKVNSMSNTELELLKKLLNNQ